MLVDGIEVKTNQCLADLQRLHSLASGVESAIGTWVDPKSETRLKRFFERARAWLDILYYKTEFVKVLAVTRFPLLHTRKIHKFTEALGMTGTGDKNENIKEQFDNIAVWISVHLGLTPKQVMEGTTIKQSQQIYFQYELKRLHELADALNVKSADYKPFMAQLQADIRRNIHKLKTIDNKPSEPPKVVPLKSIGGLAKSLVD